MAFTTDQQTLTDLNIFGRNGTQSVYEIFNKTSTRGAAEIMKRFFENPLSDAAAINKRTETIQDFITVPKFPFDTELFDIAELYLSNADQRTKLAPHENSIGKKITNLIAEDAGYKTIYNGVVALLAILQALRVFIHSNSTNSASGKAFLNEMILLSNDAAFTDLPRDVLKSKLSYQEVSRYDVILRFHHRELIKQLLTAVYHLDVYITVAKTAAERAYTFPKALPDHLHCAYLENMYHPQVNHAIPNTITLTPDSNIVFLTGANMAGKSTFMKSFGISLYLAHMGFPVPAKKMEFSVMNGIYTTINLSDNLQSGASHFYAEVLRLKKVAKELNGGKNLVVIFDELFRGTNVKDAYEATLAITSAFAKNRNAFFLISTHIIEVGDVLKKQHSNISFQYLPTTMDGNKPVYTYRLASGITDDRHGMIIINNEGIVDLLKRGKGATS